MKPIDHIAQLVNPHRMDLTCLTFTELLPRLATLGSPLCLCLAAPGSQAIADERLATSESQQLVDPRSTWTPIRADNAIWAQPVRSFW